MSLKIRNIVTTILLCFYIAGGVLIELTHYDELALPSHTETRFQHHDCSGADSHHSPEASHCLACTLAKHRVAIEMQQHIPLKADFASHGIILRSLGRVVETDIFFSGKRGPPAV